MQRDRFLNVKKDGSFFLISTYKPTQEADINENFYGCKISYDHRKKVPIKVEPFPTLALELPPLYLVAEEMSYMFNLVKSLLPYEVSQTSEIKEDF